IGDLQAAAPNSANGVGDVLHKLDLQGVVRGAARRLLRIERRRNRILPAERAPVSKVHPSGRNARSDANIAWHSEAVGGEIGYRNSAGVEAGTVGISGADRAHATSIQSASNRVAGSRLIEEPAISNMIDVDSHEQVRANVAEIVRAQNTALPELPL